MIALLMNRNNETATANSAVKSIKEFSLNSEEMGMYWKENISGYYWYQAPVETQALMIEVFGEVAKDETSVQALQVWLLRRNKLPTGKQHVPLPKLVMLYY